MNCMVGGLTRQTVEASVHPSRCAGGFHANPPRESLKHFEGAGNTEEIGDISVTYNALWFGQQRHINAEVVINGRPTRWPGYGTAADQQERGSLAARSRMLRPLMKESASWGTIEEA